MDDSIIYEFSEKGFPIVKVFSHRLEIKARDYWEYRIFLFSEIKEVKFYDPNSSEEGLPFYAVFARSRYGIFKGDCKLRIYKTNGDYWDYFMSNKENTEFVKLVRVIRDRLKEEK